MMSPLRGLALAAIPDLTFQGVSGEVLNTFFTNGVQFDASYVLNDQHTLRGGFIAEFTAERLETNTTVFPVDPVSGAVGDTPFNIPDNSGNHGVSANWPATGSMHSALERSRRYLSTQSVRAPLGTSHRHSPDALACPSFAPLAARPALQSARDK